MRKVTAYRVRAVIVLLVACAVFLVGASAGADPTGPPPDRTVDDLLASVAKEVPAFGGMYVDESTGTLYIWLTDQGQSLSAAHRALQRVLGDPSLAALTPVALPARYSFTQLEAWSDRITPVLSLPGVVSTDIDDRSNRLRVEVESLAADGPAVRARLSELGVPAEAVDIVQAEPVSPLPIIRDRAVPFAVIALASLAAIVASVALLVAWKKAGRRARPGELQ